MPRGDTIFEAGDEVLAMVTGDSGRGRRAGSSPASSASASRTRTSGCTSRLPRWSRDDALEIDPATGRDAGNLAAAEEHRGQHRVTIGDRCFERIGAARGTMRIERHLARHPHPACAARRWSSARLPARSEHHSARRSRSTCSVGFVRRSTNFPRATAKPPLRSRRVGDRDGKLERSCRPRKSSNNLRSARTSADPSSSLRCSHSSAVNLAAPAARPRSSKHVANSVGPRPAGSAPSTLQSAATAARINSSVKQSVLDSSQSYADGAILAPLRKGRLDQAYAQIFDRGVRRAATGHDRSPR